MVLFEELTKIQDNPLVMKVLKHNLYVGGKVKLDFNKNLKGEWVLKSVK